VELIKADYEKISDKVIEINQIFGKPYRKALGSFASALGLEELELKKKWLKTYKKEIARGGHPSQIFIKFMGKYDRSKTDKAALDFKKTVESRSVETINPANINDTIMEALGHPRQMSAEACKTYISNMREGVLEILCPKKRIPEEGEHILALSDSTQNLSFGEFESRMPRADQTKYIVKHWKLLEDLAFRLKESKVKTISSISKTTLKGEEDNGYLYLNYGMAIEGPQETIRDFLNNLQSAYVDNRIYIIRDFKISKTIDGYENLAQAVEESTKNSASAKRTGDRRNPRREDEERELMEKNTAAKKFGSAVIGKSIDILLNIKFDYVIYIKDEIIGGGK